MQGIMMLISRRQKHKRNDNEKQMCSEYYQSNAQLSATECL